MLELAYLMFKRVVTLLGRLFSRWVAEDAVQEAFIILDRALQRPRPPMFFDAKGVAQWLGKAGWYCAQHRAQGEGRRRKHSDRYEAEIDLHVAPSAGSQIDEGLLDLQELLSELTPDDVHRAAGLTPDADRDLSYETCRKRQQRALRRVQEAIQSIAD